MIQSQKNSNYYHLNDYSPRLKQDPHEVLFVFVDSVLQQSTITTNVAGAHLHERSLMNHEQAICVVRTEGNYWDFSTVGALVITTL